MRYVEFKGRLQFDCDREHSACGGSRGCCQCPGTLEALLSACIWTHQFVVLILIHCTIPSMYVRILVLTVVVCVLVLGLGLGSRAGVPCVVSSDAVIQGFSENHDSSCARLNALQNSRMERGHHVRRGVKRPSAGSLCKVRLSAGKKRALSQQQPVAKVCCFGVLLTPELLRLAVKLERG